MKRCLIGSMLAAEIDNRNIITTVEGKTGCEMLP